MLRRNRKKISGQAIAEYALMLAMFTAVALTLFFLFAVLTEFGWRAVALIAWEPA